MHSGFQFQELRNSFRNWNWIPIPSLTLVFLYLDQIEDILASFSIFTGVVKITHVWDYRIIYTFVFLKFYLQNEVREEADQMQMCSFLIQFIYTSGKMMTCISRNSYITFILISFVGLYYLYLHSSLDGIAKETTPKTKNVMVVTSWRSGSTLMGELLNSYPHSFLSFEPLEVLGGGGFTNPSQARAYNGHQSATTADKVLKGLLTCQYTQVLQECK